MLGFDALNLRSNRIPPNRNDWPDARSSSSSSSSSSTKPTKRCCSIQTKFGEDVLWHPSSTTTTSISSGHHLSPTELEPYRQIGDPPLDEILHLLHTEQTPLLPHHNLLTLATQATATPPSSRTPSQQALTTFLHNHATLPPWVDLPQLERGQTVFLSYAPAISLSLYYRSLIAGFSIPKIAAVVLSTGYLAPPSRPEETLQRLLDTGQLVTSCICFGGEGLCVGGEGWSTALHVRVLHAKIRWGLLHNRNGTDDTDGDGDDKGRRRRRKKKWDTEYYGVPINAEDMAGTLLAFSTNAIMGVELVAGIGMTKREEEDYLALWRYIGWLLGVDVVASDDDDDIDEYPANTDATNDSKEVGATSDGGGVSRLRPLDPCGPGQHPGQHQDPIIHSRSILQSIIFHILEPDETSIQVAHHLLKANSKTNKSKNNKSSSSYTSDFANSKWFYFRSLQCRRFIGNPLADALSLPLHPHTPTRIFLTLSSTLYLTILRGYTLMVMFVPPFRRRMVRWHRDTMRRVYTVWKETHRGKLVNALRAGEKVGLRDANGVAVVGGDDDDRSDNGSNKDDEVGGTKGDGGGCCPFAMVAPPTMDFPVSPRKGASGGGCGR